MEEKKYSIVHIIDTLEAGGAERVLVTLCNIFAAKGHKVCVITTIENTKPLADQLNVKIELQELNRKSKLALADMKRMIEWCKPFDIVHVHSSHNLRYVFLAAKIFGLGKQIFFHEHFGNIEVDDSVSWHQRLIYPKTVLIAVSRKIQEWAIEKLKMDAHKVFLLPNIVEAQCIMPLQKTGTNDALKLLLVSNFRRPKHIEFAVDLVAFIKQKRKIHLTIVGQKGDGVYCDEILERIASHELNADITIVHDCASVQSILHQFDMAMHVAKTESGPLVLIEYMAQGLPFLTHKTGEVVYQIEHDVPECLIENFDVANWFERINELLKNRERLSNTLKSLYGKYYSEERYYEACLSIYKQGYLV